jgi:hypothetical protein
MTHETIDYGVKGPGIGLLSLNRPRVYNAVSHRMMEELHEKRLDLHGRDRTAFKSRFRNCPSRRYPPHAREIRTRIAPVLSATCARV